MVTLEIDRYTRSPHVEDSQVFTFTSGFLSPKYSSTRVREGGEAT